MLGGFVDQSFVKRSLTFSILALVLLPTFIGIFFPTYDSSMDQELAELGDEYYRMTGSSPTAEETWALTGIYTPYGVAPDGSTSTAWGQTKDGWVYGARIADYTPSQMGDLNAGREGYTVTYDTDKGLYYYTAAGSDLSSVTVSPENPEQGTLYTSVALDVEHKSNRFFTSGDRTQREDGTFYYDFTGYRYVFQPLRDYKASNDLNVDKTTSSLSLIWYSYFGDDGLSSQLIISGDNEGIAYLTSTTVMERFNQAAYSSRFDMVFNGITMYITIQLNPYALQHYSVEECWTQGYWAVMVTSPAVTDSGGLTLNALSPDRMWDTVCSLLTFHMDKYGLDGAAGTVASITFTMSFYTTLIAIGLSIWPVLILAGILAAFQGLSLL